eukprot:CAMPEP_0169361744 /NCGR_PEP_ID=MMETSP1017-20121227/30523_1 /TAXON_ID=342587 /ORGANISM="Karlodinium micrum, Strain CCMP2283" /LENGTH=196 /DNA_ID=CAMNT_0009459187 /DNA_START=75 /DNA_END=663 /DNA_ORIENTATION=-
MARVGVANYAYSADHPVKIDRYWRSVLDRDQRDHSYSALNERFPKASYAYLSTTSNDFMGRTWQLLDHTRTSAAGKSCFHHNVSKPSGVVRGLSATASFEPSFTDRSSGRSARIARSTGERVLGNSASAPTLYPSELLGLDAAPQGPGSRLATPARSKGVLPVLVGERLLDPVSIGCMSTAEPFERARACIGNVDA